MPSVYEIVIKVGNRRLANEVKKRVERYDMNKNPEIRAIHEDKERCPKCQRVLRKQDMIQNMHTCGELIDYEFD